METGEIPEKYRREYQRHYVAQISIKYTNHYRNVIVK
jgi:hypothetical protein